MFIQTESNAQPGDPEFCRASPCCRLHAGLPQRREGGENRPWPKRLSTSTMSPSGVFLGHDFVTVTRSGGEWQQLKPAILGVIMDQYMSGVPVLADDSKPEAAEGEGEFFDEDHAPLVKTIKDLLDSRVRPAWRRMVAISPSRASRMVLSISTCRAPARVARLQRRR